MRLHHWAGTLFADYFQFYLWDAGMSPEAPVDYTDADTRRRIKTGPHVVVVSPERNATVPVVIEVHDADPGFNAEDWDHVAEASLHLPTGRLQVHECTGGAVADFTVEPGWYRVRSHHGGFNTIGEFGADGNDHYLVAVWPAPPSEVAVVKQWQQEPR